MTKPVTGDRPISPAEVTVIQVMLERAAVSPEYSRLNTNLSTWDTESPRTQIADGTGETPSGNPVGVIIWGSADSVTGIEVYANGGTEDDLRLPTTVLFSPCDAGLHDGRGACCVVR
jgi:hypothetical protein